MRTLLSIVAAFLTCSFLFSAEETTVKLRNEVLSKYVKRGVLRNEDPVVRSEMQAQHGIWGAGFWANFDMTDKNNSNAGDVSDFGISMKVEKTLINNEKGGILNSLTPYAGVEYLGYAADRPGNQENTSELFIGVKVGTIFGLEHQVELRYDVDEVNGGYLSYDLSRPTKVAKVSLFKRDFDVVLTPSAGVGAGSGDWCEYYLGRGELSVTDYHVGLSAALVSERFEFGPSVTYSSLIDEECRQNTKAENDNVVFGFSLAVKW